MSIYTRQYQKIVAAEILKTLLLGRLPNINDISQRIGNALSNKNNITYKYVPQPFREVFQNEVYNKSLNRIKFDIDLFHEDLLDLFAEAAKRTNFADLYHKINSYELKKLQAELELLLFTVADADFYFDGAVDTFSDTTKIDSAASTKDVIDLSEQSLVLPYGGKNTKRINVGSLVNQLVVPVTISNNQIVDRFAQLPNTKFGNIFDDSLSVWGYEVITTENVPLDISFSFILNSDGQADSEFFVSRFELVPHSYKKQTVSVTTSNDDVNYINILGYEQGIVTEDQKKNYAMDFETTLVQYIKVRISKAEADEEILEGSTKKYRYVFGLKRFAAYQTGRSSNAVYISKPFSFKNSTSIGKVSINTEQFMPGGTSINYYVAGVSANGTSSFVPITPIGTDSAIGSGKIVKFNSNIQKTSKFTVTTAGNDSPQAYGSAFQGKEFYRIGPSISTDYIFGSSKLYRGFNSWFRDYTGSFEILNVLDNYVSFEQTDLEALYTTITEIPEITPLGIGEDGIRRLQLKVSKLPYYDSSRGHSLKPQPGTQNSNLDTRPNYAVYRITHKADTTRKTTPFSLGSSRTQYLPNSNFIIESNTPAELPVIRSLTGQIFTIGVDYTFETIDIGGRSRPTGRMVIPNGSQLLDSSGNVINYALEFVYTIDPNITHKVSRIEGNNIILEHSSNGMFDPLEITYRYIPTAPSQIIKSSIRVSNLPSTSSGRTFYVEGRDYVVDPGTGGIQRIPTGNISTKGSVYVNFSYRGSSSSVQTFTTWAFINNPNGAQIKFDLDNTTKKNKLIVDAADGEAFYVNSKDGLINLTNSTTSPVLSYGWVQFIVRSKDPTANSTYGTNLIDQVIQLKDVNKRKVFKSFSTYFNEITAFREPLQEKTVNHLKVNTLLSDHGIFAIDNKTDPLKAYLLLNFKPNETTELYSKVPTEDSDETSPPQSTNEEFLFEWSEKTDDEASPTQVIVKIELNRNQDTDGAITPKVFSYQLRVGS